MIWIRNGDAVVHARVEGEGPTVAFANSLGTDLRLWDGVLDRVPCRSIRFDMRGHGLTPDRPGSVAEVASDLAAILDAHAPEGAVVVGVSVGGLVAQALWAARPDLVRGLVLSNTGIRIGTRDVWAERVAAVERGGVASISDAIMARWFTPAWQAANAQALAGWRCMVERGSDRGYAALGRAIAEADLEAAARSVAVPTLCIGGSGDGATPPDVVAALARAVPGARLEIIDGAGHLPMIDAPDRFAALLGDFLRSVG